MTRVLSAQRLWEANVQALYACLARALSSASQRALAVAKVSPITINVAPIRHSTNAHKTGPRNLIGLVCSKRGASNIQLTEGLFNE